MKKFKTIKSKIIMFLFALLLPLSATGFVYSITNTAVAKAEDSTSTNYYSGYLKEVSMSNNNFNSSTSTYSISTSLSGWTGQMTDKRTTAGIINVGNTFQNYMTGTYRLSKNPMAKAADKQILMINSKTDDSLEFDRAQQGYKSNTITLDANSYYSFQVSYKSDTNYNSYTSYEEKGKVQDDTYISKSTFETKNFGNDLNNYISFTYQSKTYYLHKNLTEYKNLDEEKKDVKLFYEEKHDVIDETTENLIEYVGFMYNDGTKDIPVYITKDNLTTENVGGEDQINIKAGAKLYTSDITYTNENGNERYLIKGRTQDETTGAVTFEGTPFYTTKTEYTSLNDYVFGSIYLDGLTDEDGNPVKAEYVKVTSKNWVTFYFFVATGAKEQSVTMDLWLGSSKTGQESSGVVFFDDCHVYQYSENTFWKTYQSYFGKNYTQTTTNSDGSTSTETTNCTSLVDLRKNDVLKYSANNFDFESGPYEDLTALKSWKLSGKGNAQIFNTNSPAYFSSRTGYDFVGSTLSCDVELDENLKVSITPNQYCLGLWTKDNSVKVTSNDIAINSNEIYKITAYYKISELTSGNVYMFVKENDNIYEAYGLKKENYNLTDETASSAVTTNGSSEFSNNYGKIEFFIKGGVHYNSSVNISLGLGKEDESSTGCVCFDDIKIEKATSAEYESGSNKIELDTKSGTQTIANGNFNNVTISDNYVRPYAPNNWTLTNGDGITFGGVINTEASQYEEYKRLYEKYSSEGYEDIKNPYVWANTFGNPKNSDNNTSMPDNVLMLANLNNTWQKLKSEEITLDASTTSKIKFNYKTYSVQGAKVPLKVTLYGEDGFKLFESEKISSNGEWTTFEIYLKTLAGANKVYLEVDLGTKDDKVQGVAYLDNFKLSTIDSTIYDEKESVAEGNGNAFGVVDMTDYYLNLPTNNITNDLSSSTTPAYTGSVSSKNEGIIIEGGIYKSDMFKKLGLNDNGFYIDTKDQDPKNVFFITSSGVGSYSIDSNFNLDLKADNYYELTFKVKTRFNYVNEDVELDKKKTYSYGATVGLSGFDYATGIVSNDDYEEYTLHFKPTDDASAKIHIALVCDTVETSGSVVIYDFNLQEFSSDDGKETYDAANTLFGDKNYDLNKDKVFISKAENASDDDNTDDDNTTDEDTTNNEDFSWLWIPSLITGLAIVIAVVGWMLRKVKIKKIERKRVETYDRKSSLNVDAVKIKAKKQKELDEAEVKKTREKFEKELENLETSHKQKVLDLRSKDKGQFSKETDKEFKQFAQKRTVIAEKIDSLNKQIEQINSPEYLLNLERKIFAQEEMKQRELAKVSKKFNKEQEKKSKGNSEKK